MFHQQNKRLACLEHIFQKCASFDEMHHSLRLSLEVLRRAVTLNILMCFLTVHVCSDLCPIYIFLLVNCSNFKWLLIPHKVYGLSYSLLICGLSVYFFYSLPLLYRSSLALITDTVLSLKMFTR